MLTIPFCTISALQFKSCAYFSLGIRMKGSLNETILVLLPNTRLPCWKMCNPSVGARWCVNLEWPYYFNKSYSWSNENLRENLNLNHSQNLRESCDILLYSLWLPQCVTSWGFLKYCYIKLGRECYTKKQRNGTDSYINVFEYSQKTTIPFPDYKKPWIVVFLRLNNFVTCHK